MSNKTIMMIQLSKFTPSRVIRGIRNRILVKNKVGRDILRIITRLSNYFRKSELKYPILVNSIPKAGTNLLRNVILSIPGTNFVYEIEEQLRYGLEMLSESEDAYFSLLERKMWDMRGGTVYVGHNPYTEKVAEWLKKNKIKHVLIIRDPRDYTVSLYHYISNPKVKHPRFHLFQKMKTNEERLLGAILGIGEGKHKFDMSWDSVVNVYIMYSVYLGWLYDPNTLCVRYEDFISENGVSPRSKNTIRKILEYLEITPSDELIEKIIRDGFDPSKSHTFRKGRAGTWKEEYKEEHIRAFIEIGGKEILEKFGYSW